MSNVKACLGCGTALPEPFLDLGLMPPANSYLKPSADQLEQKYRLAVAFCPECYLVQLTDLVAPEDLFSNYLYFSSYSDIFLKHAEKMAADLTDRFGLDNQSFVLEAASNDGYLLKYFIDRGVLALGVEPAKNIAELASERGIPTVNDFFSSVSAPKIVAERGLADLIIGNNVLAHVPTVNDFLSAACAAIKPDGAVVFEFPYLVNLLDRIEFDTIYHEHVFYYSLSAIANLFERAGLELFDVKEFPIHGGSVRVFGQRPGARPVAQVVAEMLDMERRTGVTVAEAYKDFAGRTEQLRVDLLGLLKGLKLEGKRLAAYGAPAKGNTLLNYCDIGVDLIDFTVDRSPHKQGLLTPGMHIPISAPEKLVEEMPDYTVILPWNIAGEIVEQQAAYRAKGGRFILPIPQPKVIG